MYKRLAFLLPMLLVVLIMSQALGFAQCAMCRTALESSQEGKGLAGSFRQGILLLLGAPYLMLGITGFAVFRAYRKKRKEAGFGRKLEGPVPLPRPLNR